jgi:hypothetical protein
MHNLPWNFGPAGDRPGWFKMLVSGWLDLESSALQLQEQLPLPIQVVCGCLGDDDGHAIYLIENASPVDLAREFETGSHNKGDDMKKVCDELAQVFDVAPFRPYFVDAAGYKAKFLSPITRERASLIESILTVGLEGYDESDSSGNGSAIAESLIAENGFRLWWD